MDDEGQVEDMDGYLNYLSLEYDSVWDTKPSWYVSLFFPLLSAFLFPNWTMLCIGFDSRSSIRKFVNVSFFSTFLFWFLIE